MKTSLSSFELKHVISELQVLVGSKIEKVFQQLKPRDDFLFSIHVPSKGKKFLYLSLPNAICLSSFKPVFPDMPPAFCSSLRRKITNAKIISISQHAFERIIIIELTTKHGASSLIIELFSSGNIILVDDENVILATLNQKIWNENRKILHGQIYQFPNEQVNPSTLTRDKFIQLLKKSTKDTLVTFLAIDCSLGGTYAEYVLSKTSLDKSAAPSSILSSSKELFDSLQNLFTLNTNAIVDGNEVFPIALSDGEAIDSFNEGIASLLLKHLEAVEHKELTKSKTESLSKFDKIIAKQTHQRDGLVKSAEKNQESGELIYTHYQEVKTVLDLVKEMKKTSSWVEIKEALKEYSFIKSVDEHKGEIKVDLT